MMSPPLSQSSAYNNNNNGRNNNNDRRSASLNPQHRDVQRDRPASNQLSMFHYGDRSDEIHHQSTRTTQPPPPPPQQQQRDFDPSINRHYQPKPRTYVNLSSTKISFSFSLSLSLTLFNRKSPIRTTINSNNNRVLSVSGKLRCSRCNDELGDEEEKKPASIHMSISRWNFSFRSRFSDGD